ncbi:MAG TPA: biotin/lipoyl-containing protein, partial [Nevskiaceae bacterium]|nr:biotin/lipoyl-containing protein [Nevskiaceae bacterium]
MEGLSMGASIEVKVPDIGDYHDVPVIEVLVKDGDRVEKDAPLAVLESDKATMEVPAPEAGTVRGIKIKAGDKVSQGHVICSLETAAAAPATKSVAAARSEPAKPAPPKKDASPAPAPPVAAAAGGTIEVKVPDIGDYHDVPVIEVLVKDGDAVEKDAPLAVLESDKATMEVPAPAAGVV